VSDNNVRLLVGGVEHGGWKSVRIEAGIERVARSFSLSFTERWPGSGSVASRLPPGSLCEVWIGPDKVLTGFVDAMPFSDDGGSYTISARGRSKTADLVDCAAINTPGQWRKTKLEAIASAMASVYGIKVIAAIDTGPVVLDHQIQPGESVFESVDRLLQLRQLLAADDESGRLILLQAGSSGRASTAIERGVNILSTSADRDYSGVYSEYICKGQRATTDDEDIGPAVTETTGVATQAGIRKRVMVIRQAGQADGVTCQDRVDYEQAYRLSKARSATYTVNGWRQASGQLWSPNQLVRVRDPVLGFDEDLLITEVAWSSTDKGLLTELAVSPVDGYLNRRAKNRAKKAAKKGSGVDTWADIK
jgi:prophage tail gpP-like protein